MIRSMAKALAYAHDNDIVHSDFKPANVFLTRKKQIKVLDFGLARANPTSLLPEGGSLLDPPALGGMTPEYASPEMLDGKEPTPSDDVFALAIVAFELLTGRHPFDYERPDAARFAAVKATPLPGLSRLQRKSLMRAFVVRPRRSTQERGRVPARVRWGEQDQTDRAGRRGGRGRVADRRLPGLGAERPAHHCVRGSRARGARAVRARRGRRADGIVVRRRGHQRGAAVLLDRVRAAPRTTPVRCAGSRPSRTASSRRCRPPTRPRAARSSACSTATTT